MILPNLKNLKIILYKYFDQKKYEWEGKKPTLEKLKV